jgi:hypothetical protein
MNHALLATESTAAETLGAIGSLGPTALILIPLAFALLVVLGFVAAGTVAVTGVRRFGMPGLAYTLGGVRLELHGLRSDLRAWQSGDPLPDLEPLDERRSLFPPPRRPTPDTEAAPARGEPVLAPASRRAGRARQASRPG